MPNLGSFAGGLADGIVAGGNLALKKKQLADDKAYNDKVLTFKQNEDTRSQADADYKAKTRSRTDAFQARADALHAEYADDLGDGDPTTAPQPAAAGDVAAPAAGAAPTTGNLGAAAMVGTTGATPNPATPQPAAGGKPNAERQARRMQYLSRMAALHTEADGDPAHITAMTDYMKKNGDDDHLRMMRDGIARGDPKAFSTLVKEYGGDPDKAHVDLSAGTIDIGNGKPQDLGMFLRLGGASVLADEMDANKKSKQGDQKFDSDMKTAVSERGLKGAQAYEATKRGDVAGVQKTAMLDEKKQRDLDIKIGKDVGYQPDATTGGPGQKAAEWTDGRRWLSQRVTQDLGADPKANLNAVYTKHLGDFNAIKSDVDSDWRQLSGPVKASLVDKYKDAPNPEMAAKQAYLSSQLDNADGVLQVIKAKKARK